MLYAKAITSLHSFSSLFNISYSVFLWLSFPTSPCECNSQIEKQLLFLTYDRTCSIHHLIVSTIFLNLVNLQSSPFLKDSNELYNNIALNSLVCFAIIGFRNIWRAYRFLFSKSKEVPKPNRRHKSI